MEDDIDFVNIQYIKIYILSIQQNNLQNKCQNHLFSTLSTNYFFYQSP